MNEVLSLTIITLALIYLPVCTYFIGKKAGGRAKEQEVAELWVVIQRLQKTIDKNIEDEQKINISDQNM